jgi:hypothetical protein
MAGFTRIALAFFLAAVQLPAAFALDDAPATISQELVPFSSDEGLTRLARSTAKVDFPDLANQFEAESNGAFCGPTSAAIVLNAVRGRSADLPRDRSRLRPEDLQYIPSAYDPTLPRFTQDNVITKGQKTRAQVLGEPVTINGKQIKDFGYQVRQLDEMLRANGLTTRLIIVDDSKVEQDIRRDAAGLRAEHRDAVSQKHRLVDAVGDEENRGALVLPNLQQFLLQAPARLRVECPERFVHQERAWPCR